MSRTRYVGGTYTIITGGDHYMYSAEEINFTSNGAITETAKEGITYGEPESIKLEDAFIPLVELIQSKHYNYIFEDIEGKVYELDFKLDRDKRKQGAKKLRFTTDDKYVYLTFKVSKGNHTSEDEDGIVRAKIHFKNGEMEEKEIDTAYGETFDLFVEVDKLAYIQFFADDDFYFFNGNVSNVFCGQIVYDCQKPLRKEAVMPITHLTKEERAIFMATVLCESGNGKRDLQDIAYIYLNLIHSRGSFEAAMRESSAYRDKTWVYDFHLRHLLIDNNIKFHSDYTDWENNKEGKKADVYEENLEDRVETKRKEAKDFISFCEKNIFIDSPISLYKDWEGQGNFEDMNIRMHNDKKWSREKWAMASQYFHLQNQCKVKEKLVVELLDKTKDRDKNEDGTTYLFHQTKIEEYFKKNPDKLPIYADGDLMYSRTGKKIDITSPKNAIPPAYGFRKPKTPPSK
ncbi:MAG: hypothetical protein QM535_12250 [Limnohabitans sp.]|nr:hypothetical protein [Limnohabitans sp.]